MAAALPNEGPLLRTFDREEPLVLFDIGACEGEDSVRYARLFPRSHVYAVEPLPENVRRAMATIAKHGAGRVTMLPFALAEVEGEMDMHVSSGQPPGARPGQDWDYGNKSSSLLPPGPAMSSIPWLRFESTVTVPVRTLDDICRELGIDRIDYVHLDVQGAELKVLAGGEEMLRSVRAIWLEVETVPLYDGQPLVQDVAAYLSSKSFRLEVDMVSELSGDQFWVRDGRARMETA